jgi:hypothetical protein
MSLQATPRRFLIDTRTSVSVPREMSVEGIAGLAPAIGGR